MQCTSFRTERPPNSQLTDMSLQAVEEHERTQNGQDDEPNDGKAVTDAKDDELNDDNVAGKSKDDESNDAKDEQLFQMDTRELIRKFRQGAVSQKSIEFLKRAHQEAAIKHQLIALSLSESFQGATSWTEPNRPKRTR